MQIQLEGDIERKVREAAQAQKISEGFLVGEVLKRWLEDDEDREDYAAGIQSLSKWRYTISLDEFERRSDVAD